MATSAIMTDERFPELKEQLATLDRVDREIALAKRANIPIGDAEDQSRAQRKQIMDLLQTYYPGRT